GQGGAQLALAGLQHRRRRAPGQELRVAGHIVDQVIEGLWRIRQQGRALDTGAHQPWIPELPRRPAVATERALCGIRPAPSSVPVATGAATPYNARPMA